MSGKKRIFISSVQKELAPERRALKDYIQGDPFLGRFFDVFLFEDSPASGRRADEVYLNEVDCCDIYLALLGSDYGHEDADGISPTEREFDRATAAAKERLVFVKGDDSARREKMQALVRKAGNQVVRRRFAGIPELNALVYSSLVKYLVNTGVVRTCPFDASACPDAATSDLSRKKLFEFLARARAERNYPLGPRTPMEKALAHLNLLDNGQPSHAAVLLFGKQPQRFLITSEVKCLHFHGMAVAKPIPYYQIYRGTVFELVDQAVDFVMSRIAAAVGTRAQSNQAPVTYELPRPAVAEAVVNAVAHRDYASNASVQVMLFADRLEVWNPGQLPPPLTPESLRLPHASIPHNPLIAEPLFLTRYIEKAGTGILDMIGLCQAANLPAPHFRQDGGQFVQTLWRPKGVKLGPSEAQETQVGTKLALSRHQVIILHKCREEKGLVDLMAITGRTDRTKFRRQVLASLLAEGLIEMTVPDKPQSRNQKYRLTDKGHAWLSANEKEGSGK